MALGREEPEATFQSPSVAIVNDVTASPICCMSSTLASPAAGSGPTPRADSARSDRLAQQPLPRAKVRPLLQQHGWTLEHIRGSHHILRKDGKTLSVPVHAGKYLGQGLVPGYSRRRD